MHLTRFLSFTEFHAVVFVKVTEEKIVPSAFEIDNAKQDSPHIAGVAKLRPTSRIRPADQFNPARQIPCTFFSRTVFPTVDSSAIALAAACHINRIAEMIR